MEEKSIYYIGNSLAMLRCMAEQDQFKLAGMICEKKHMTDEMQKSVAENSIPLYGVENKRQLTKVCRELRLRLAVMYSFGIIIPPEILGYADIYNIHPGSLKDNRGSSPLNWSILRNEKETEITLHKVSAQIDAGEVVAVKKLSIQQTDTPVTLRQKAEQLLPQVVEDLGKFLDAPWPCTVRGGGIYRPRIEEKDYTIHPETDTDDIILAKIRSQAEYSGAILEWCGQKFYVRSLEEVNAILRHKERPR